MNRSSHRVRFENSKGITLSGIVELPVGETIGHCLFAHCFTCGKDLKAIVRISRHLAAMGFAVLRFDFTGLGNSGGQFSETTFVDNCEDIRAATRWLEQEFQSPELLIGYSLGGGATMAIAGEIASVKGLVTIASPSDTHHLAKFLARTNPDVVERGQGQVKIGVRNFTITRAMLDELEQYNLESRIRQLTLPHLILHSPQDETLAFVHAQRIFEWTGGPATMVNLSDSDHLFLKHPRDVEFVARWIAVWGERVLSLN